MTTVTFGKGSKLTKIGAFAFSLASVETFVAPPRLRTLSEGAFCWCLCLTKVVLNEGLEALGGEGSADVLRYQGVFEHSAVEELALPHTLRRIGYAVFRSCQDLKRVSLPDGLTHLGGQCFAKSGIEGVTVPDSVTEISEKAFASCESLKSVVFGENSRVEKIRGDAFSSTSLESFVLPLKLRNVF